MIQSYLNFVISTSVTVQFKAGQQFSCKILKLPFLCLFNSTGNTDVLGLFPAFILFISALLYHRVCLHSSAWFAINFNAI